MASHLNWLITPAVLLPNMAFLTRIPNCLPPTEVVDRKSRRAVGIIENLSRISVFAIPFFCSEHLGGSIYQIAALVMMASLTIYYAGWARYFAHSRQYPLLYEPLMGIPLPLAIAPVPYFLAGSILLRSIPLACVALVFGVAHICISEQEHRRCLDYSQACAHNIRSQA